MVGRVSRPFARGHPVFSTAALLISLPQRRLTPYVGAFSRRIQAGCAQS